MNTKISTLLLMLVWLMPLSQQSVAAPDEGLRTIEITASPLQLTIQRTGQVDYRYLTQLSFQSTGYIEQLSLDEGDAITQGQTIASLDTAIIKANLASAMADHTQAVSDLARAEKLFEEKTVSADQLENAQTRLKTSRAQLEVARFNLRKAQIAAPFDGVVISRQAQAGELAAAGAPIYQVARAQGDTIIRLDLTQEEVRLIGLQQKATAQLTPIHTLSTWVEKIATRASATTGMYAVELALPHAPPTLRAGLWLPVTIPINHHQPVFALPLKALTRIEQGNAVFMVAQDGRLAPFSAPIVHFDQQVVYVPATQESIALVVEGWNTQLLKTKVTGG